MKFDKFDVERPDSNKLQQFLNQKNQILKNHKQKKKTEIDKF